MEKYPETRQINGETGQRKKKEMKQREISEIKELLERKRQENAR